MPHQCTNCGRAFADGSKQMLAGCPDCGGNKFQFLPKSDVDTPSESPGGGGSGGSRSQIVPPSRDPKLHEESGSDIIEAPAEPVDGLEEDRAQASARRSVVSEDELPPPPDPRERAPPDPEAERPGLAELREELNEQFESIKILRPGEYELNLMELYNREEYIIALEEDGRYVIDVPDTWREAE